MAKDKDNSTAPDADIEELKKSRRKRGKKANIGWRGQILIIFGFFLAIVMLPSAIVVLFAMLPTTVAVLVDRLRNGTLALTVGAMNLAGATPFLLELWERGHTPDIAIEIVSNPTTVTIMYGAAAVGYLIDWAMSGITQTFMVEKGHMRLKEIERIQAALAERWGKEVTGELPLDEHGFPINPEERT